MKEVEYFTFMLPPDIWRKKSHPSSFKLTMEQAARRHPGATPILSTREVQTLPDTEDEIRTAVAAWPRGHSGSNNTEEAIGRHLRDYEARMKEQDKLRGDPPSPRQSGQ